MHQFLIQHAVSVTPFNDYIYTYLDDSCGYYVNDMRK